MKSVRISVNAKVNLSLNVLGITPNNYHTLESVMASVNISDAVSVVKRNDKNVYLSSRDMAIGPRNSAIKAANAFIAAFNTGGCDITLRKRIPFSAGLGGSSADAAAVLAGLEMLYETGDKKVLTALAISVGSDVPFMLEGGTKLVSGVGETVCDIGANGTLYLVAAKPERGVSTAECYRRFDEIGGESADNQKLTAALQSQNLAGIAANTVNALERAALSLMPEIGEIKKLLEKEKPLSVFMTGSGSAVIALCESKQQADFIASRIKDKVFWCGSLETAPQGIVID